MLLIRNERPDDVEAIHALTLKAFASMSFSNGSEAPLITALRQSGDLSLSLVAEKAGALVGHVAFSPVTIGGVHNGWFGLGPIAVEPVLQRGGIGKALILEGLAVLKPAAPPAAHSLAIQKSTAVSGSRATGT